MNESKIKFIKPKGFTINLPAVGEPVAVRTESDEIVILMSFAIRPRDNVMDINLDVSAGGDGASVTSFDKDASSNVSGDSGAIFHIVSQNVKRRNGVEAQPSRSFLTCLVRYVLNVSQLSDYGSIGGEE